MIDEATLKRIMQEHEALRSAYARMEQEKAEAVKEKQALQARINSEQINTYQSLLRKQFKPSDFHGRGQNNISVYQLAAAWIKELEQMYKNYGYHLRAGTAALDVRRQVGRLSSEGPGALCGG